MSVGNPLTSEYFCRSWHWLRCAHWRLVFLPWARLLPEEIVHALEMPMQMPLCNVFVIKALDAISAGYQFFVIHFLLHAESPLVVGPSMEGILLWVLWSILAPTFVIPNTKHICHLFPMMFYNLLYSWKRRHINHKTSQIFPSQSDYIFLYAHF